MGAHDDDDALLWVDGYLRNVATAAAGTINYRTEGSIYCRQANYNLRLRKLKHAFGGVAPIFNCTQGLGLCNFVGRHRQTDIRTDTPDKK